MRMKSLGIVPVIRTSSPELAVNAVTALTAGGISIAEITLTTPDALSVIETLVNREEEDLLIGAGTVTDLTSCKSAVAAGARFIVTPFVNLEVIEHCVRQEICVMSGALTPTEIFSVHQAGADAVKVFPAKAVGGPGYLKLIRDPLPHIPLVPTGGVNLENMQDYLAAGAVFVGAGTDLVNKKALADNNLDMITQRAKAYLEAVRPFLLS